MRRDDDEPDDAATAAPTPAKLVLSRRMFLGYGGTALALLTVPACRGGGAADDDELDEDDEEIEIENLDPDPGSWVTVQRPDDLVNLRFGFVNFTRADGDHMLRRDPHRPGPGLIIMVLPPQHLAERVFLEPTGGNAGEPGGPPPVATSLAQDSRIVFYVPDDVVELPLRSAGLLALAQAYAMNIRSTATAPLSTPPFDGAGTKSGYSENAGRPDELETAIELPWRLTLSPNQYGRWGHPTAPVVSSRGRTELWHSQLETVRDRSHHDHAGLRSARAIWHRQSNDVPFPSTSATLTPAERDLFTRKTGDWEDGEPVAMKVERLMVSALGGWLDATTDFPDGGIARWIHRTAMGRDYYVEIVRRGWAFPFQHQVAILTISERKLRNRTDTAYLWKRYVPLVLERTRHYQSAAPSMEKLLRQMPLASATLIDDQLPALDNDPRGTEPTLLRAKGRPLRFRVEAIDRAGNQFAVQAPILWIPHPDNVTDLRLIFDLHPRSAPYLAGLYNAATSEARCETHGQRLWLAAAADKPGDADTGKTTFETHAVTFTGAGLPVEAWDHGRIGFFPILAGAELALDAVRAVAGTDRMANGQVPTFIYNLDYINHGFTSRNPRELVMQLAPGQALRADFSTQADRSGGFVTPNLAIQGLSRLTGPVAGPVPDPVRGLVNTLEAQGAEIFAPPAGASDALALLNPKLFGCLALSELIDNGTFEQLAPKFVTDGLDELARYRKMVDGLPETIRLLKEDIARATAQVAANVRTKVLELVDRITTAVDGVVTEAKEVTRLLQALVTMPPETPINTLTDLAAVAIPSTWTRRLQALGAILLADKAAQPLYSAKPGLEVGIRTLAGVATRIAEVSEAVRAVVVTAARGLALLKQQEVTLEWNPPLQNAGPFKLQRDDQGKPLGGLTLKATMRGKASGNAPAGADLLCSLDKFDLELIGDTPFVTLHFDKLQFRTRTGKKPEIDVIFGGIGFGGPLAFIETLKEAIPLDGFSDPPGVDISPTGLTASFSLALPALAVGMFSLENVGISAHLTVPFIGDALEFKFMFSTRERPFLLTVSGLGGTGYFGIVVTPRGVNMIEAQLEFGAHVSLNFGVASGAVSVMAGIYFGLQLEPSICTLRGFLRARGEVDVLGLITASIELRMELEYRTGADADGGKVVGRAVLEVEVSIAFFSKSVEIVCERKFAGANGDPTFAQIMGGRAPLAPFAVDGTFPWRDYCGAFA